MDTATTTHRGGKQEVLASLLPSGRTCQCAGCGRYFAGVDPFDHHFARHDNKPPDCHTVAWMQQHGFTQNINGVWQMLKYISDKQLGVN